MSDTQIDQTPDLAELPEDSRTLRARAAELEGRAAAEPLPRRKEVLQLAARRLNALADVAEGANPRALLF